ncbi:hypothetical protein BI364_10130 [Acidihalobacter yilgarnensis]|uniref:Uncharacterized protein n=2 Tax=Acidihalobacter yilgarnensis TaxID=2819280 RepID=A0A1D8IP37_9GAMM|nr:hypothetical protein BI364_10130 [Acidihalobacter yilgarnensis]
MPSWACQNDGVLQRIDGLLRRTTPTLIKNEEMKMKHALRLMSLGLWGAVVLGMKHLAAGGDPTPWDIGATALAAGVSFVLLFLSK